MAHPTNTDIERLLHWQGQRLRSADFRHAMAYQAQQRHWHNRALHQAYGVNRGLQVSGVFSTDEAGNQLLTAVEVECGLAYDCFGRELILQHKLRLGLPSGAGEFLLLARHRADAGPASAGQSPPCCSEPSSAGERPDLIWMPAQQASRHDGVALALLTQGAAQEDGSPAPPRLQEGFRPGQSRPLARPRLGGGLLGAEAITWRLWIPSGHPDPVGWQTWIDTSAAGFGRTPHYAAWLQGTLWPGDDGYVPAPLASIGNASPEGFDFRLMLPVVGRTPGAAGRGTVSLSFNARRNSLFPFFAQRQELAICWLGCLHDLSKINPCPGRQSPPPPCGCNGDPSGGPSS